MITKEYYQTDFVSEYTRWYGIAPTEELINASRKKQQHILSLLRENNSHFKLVVNHGLSLKHRHSKEFIKSCIGKKKKS